MHERVPVDRQLWNIQFVRHQQRSHAEMQGGKSLLISYLFKQAINHEVARESYAVEDPRYPLPWTTTSTGFRTAVKQKTQIKLNEHKATQNKYRLYDYPIKMNNILTVLQPSQWSQLMYV